MVTLSRSDMEECGSISALRALVERRQREAYDAAGLNVLNAVLRQAIETEGGEMRFEAIPLSEFWHSAD